MGAKQVIKKTTTIKTNKSANTKQVTNRCPNCGKFTNTKKSNGNKSTKG